MNRVSLNVFIIPARHQEYHREDTPHIPHVQYLSPTNHNEQVQPDVPFKPRIHPIISDYIEICNYHSNERRQGTATWFIIQTRTLRSQQHLGVFHTTEYTSRCAYTEFLYLTQYYNLNVVQLTVSARTTSSVVVTSPQPP